MNSLNLSADEEICNYVIWGKKFRQLKWLICKLKPELVKQNVIRASRLRADNDVTTLAYMTRTEERKFFFPRDTATHTQRRTTVGRTPLGKWSAYRSDLYLTTHNNNRQNIHATSEIRTHNLSRRADADLRFRLHSHWDRRCGNSILTYLLTYLLTCLLTYLPHGAESFLRS